VLSTDTVRECTDDRTRLFSEVQSKRTRGNGHELGNGKFKLDIRKDLPDLVEHASSRRLDQTTARGPFQPKFLCANKQLQYATMEGK